MQLVTFLWDKSSICEANLCAVMVILNFNKDGEMWVSGKFKCACF